MGEQVSPNWDFFIAYASPDQARAKELHDLLAPSARVFLDYLRLAPGDNWGPALKEAQQRSRASVVLLTANTARAHYAFEEITTAIRLSREATGHRVIPVYLEPLPPEAVPYGLSGVQGIAWDSGGMAAIAAKLLEALSRESSRPASIPPVVSRITSIAAQLSYDKVLLSGQALDELLSLLPEAQPAERDAMIQSLKRFLLDIDKSKWDFIPRDVRGLRRETMNAIRAAAAGDLARHFQKHGMRNNDLFGMDFSGERLNGVNFDGSFLVAADFSRVVLDGASFNGARLRNASFTGASLADVNFTDADWYNASGFTRESLAQCRQGTLRECPPTLEALHQSFPADYAVPFNEWPKRMQRQVVAAWEQYVKWAKRPC